MTASLTEAYYRRLYAFHNPSPAPVEEFYSPSEPRDRKGKWTRGGGGPKMWTGVSADPYNRTAPKSKVHFPIEPDDYQSKSEARALFATSIYDADLGDGYHARVAGVREIHNGLGITVKFWKAGKEVGVSTRELATDGAGKLVAHHETLYIDPNHQNKGLADRFNAHAVEQYQKIGVDRIDLHAGDTVGGYAWARQGFRVFEGDRKKFLIEQLDRLKTTTNKPVLKPHRKRVLAEADALRKAIEAGEDVQPIHIASLGEKYARHEGHDDHGNTYTTWPGKSLLIGTNWLGTYYFDAGKTVTAAATDLEHAALRNQPFYGDASKVKRAYEEFFNKNHSHTDGKFTSGPSGSAAPTNGRKTLPGYVWVGDYMSSRATTGYSAEMMGLKGYDTSNTEMLWAKNEVTGKYDVPYPRKMMAGAERQAKEEAGNLLSAVYKVAPVEKSLWSGQRSDEFSKHLKVGDTIDLPTTATTSKEAESHYYPKSGGTVFRFEGGTKAVKITKADYRIPEWVTAGRFTVSAVSEKPNLVKEDRTVREVTLQQTHVFNPADGSWVPVHENVTSSAEFYNHEHDPHSGRFAGGYGPYARKDITLGSVRVTYHPKYPDDHPDPGEVVWAKVGFQEDVRQTKDRPVLIIGRINGSDKLAAVQLSSQSKGRSDELPIGTGSWDRLGRNSVVKLGQIITIDPKDYRREGSKFDKDKFEHVIGHLAAHHRTPVQIAASIHVEEFYNSNHDRLGRFATGHSSGGGGVPSAAKGPKLTHLSRDLTTPEPNSTGFGRRINEMIDADKNLSYISRGEIEARAQKKLEAQRVIDQDELVRKYTVGYPRIEVQEMYSYRVRTDAEKAETQRSLAEMRDAVSRVMQVRSEDYVAKNPSEKILQDALDQRLQADIYSPVHVPFPGGGLKLEGARPRRPNKTVVVDETIEQSVNRIGMAVKEEIDKRVAAQVDEPKVRADHARGMAELYDAVREMYAKEGVDMSGYDMAKNVRIYGNGKTLYITPPEGHYHQGANDPKLDHLYEIVKRNGLYTDSVTQQVGALGNQAHSAVLHQVLGEIVQMGGRLRGTPADRKPSFGISSHAQVTAAVKRYPENWINASNESTSLGFRQVKGRAHYQHSPNSKGQSEITLDGTIGTAVHEFAHRFERAVPAVLDLEARFYDRRTAGESLVPLGKGYGKSEQTREDKFFERYAGKTYNGSAYELLSMGFEHMQTHQGYKSIDDDYKAFVLGTLVTAYRG